MNLLWRDINLKNKHIIVYMREMKFQKEVLYIVDWCLDVCILAISGGFICKNWLSKDWRIDVCLMSFNVLSIDVDHRLVCTKGVQNSIHSLNLKIFFGSNCILCSYYFYIFLKILVLFYRFCFYEILNKDIRIRPVNKKMALKRPIFDLFTTEYSAEANNYSK